MAKYLMSPESGPIRHEYVLLGFFQQDDLEHHFGHFRRSAGCNYYIRVREVVITHNIDWARLMLSNQLINLDQDRQDRKCDHCTEAILNDDVLLLDTISETEDSCQFLDSSIDELNVIVYAAGYVAHKHKELRYWGGHS